MPLGLHARFNVDPRSLMRKGWAHDMANLLCRAKLQAELGFLKGARG